jgi:hypothetical protein
MYGGALLLVQLLLHVKSSQVKSSQVKSSMYSGALLLV